jgi:hypothetical protein
MMLKKPAQGTDAGGRGEVGGDVLNGPPAAQGRLRPLVVVELGKVLGEGSPLHMDSMPKRPAQGAFRHETSGCRRTAGDQPPPTHHVRWLAPELANGLEFDLVVVVDPDSFGTGTDGAVDCFVATTRRGLSRGDGPGHAATGCAVPAEGRSCGRQRFARP